MAFVVVVGGGGGGGFGDVNVDVTAAGIFLISLAPFSQEVVTALLFWTIGISKFK